MRNIIIFGTGIFWENRKKFVLQNSHIICFLDNNVGKWGNSLEDVAIVNPAEIKHYTYDFVLLMSMHEEEMRVQLECLGVPENKIWTWTDYRQRELREIVYFYSSIDKSEIDRIIFSVKLDYNGGSMAAIYSAKALRQKNKNVLICAEDCHQDLLKELQEDDLSVLVAPSLPYVLNQTVMEIISQCEVVLVNVFQMISVACQVSRWKPVLWWIHEPSELYQPVLREFSQYNNAECFKGINIKAVSSIPQKNFNGIYSNRITDTMAYGIPDEYDGGYFHQDKETVFAVVGSVIYRKAQDVFLDAIELLSEEERAQAKFIIIGSYGSDEYAKQIVARVSTYPNISMAGNLTREQMHAIYPTIDVVVCPSREDPLPIVMTEAMMYKKACIASDMTGTTDYISDGENGFVCKTESATDLRDKMRYFIVNKGAAAYMGENARKIYEQNYTLEKFATRLEYALQETIDKYGDTK